MAKPQILSKSRFLGGIQCPKRLWLGIHEPDRATPPNELTKFIFQTGNEVGELARERYAGGVLIDDDPRRHTKAVEATEALLRDPKVPAIYEAAFTTDGCRVRVDVLLRVGDDTFDLIEVKSGTRSKPEHVWDLAIQLHVLESAGLSIRSACLLNLNREYVYQGEKYDLTEIFSCKDLTKPVRERLPEVPMRLADMRLWLAQGKVPEIKVGPQCTTPWTCPFLNHCRKDEPEHPLRTLPRMPWKMLQELHANGIFDIRDVPADWNGLSERQSRAVKAVKTGKRYVGEDLESVIDQIQFPVRFLDFETFGPALPIYPGTSPYETVCFQWSAHTLNRDGSIEHAEFLHRGPTDPRPEFCQSLINALGTQGSIIVWSPYEGKRLSELIDAVPGVRIALSSIRERLVDFLPIVREYVYDPSFGGSFSLKSVLPGLVPHLGYSDLAIREGALASSAFIELQDPNIPMHRTETLRQNLLNYCRRDTEALLEIFRALSTSANGTSSPSISR